MNLSVKLGLAIVASLLLFEIFIAPPKQFTESPDGLTQPMIDTNSKLKIQLLDETGALNVQGFMVDGQSLIENNATKLKESSMMNVFKSFEVLAMFIDTPLHHIFITTPFVILGQVCVTKVSIM
jgi:hypothetical protein